MKKSTILRLASVAAILFSLIMQTSVSYAQSTGLSNAATESAFLQHSANLFITNSTPQPAPMPMGGAWESHPIGGRNYWGFEAGINDSWLQGEQNWFVAASVADANLTADVVMPFANAGSGIGFQLGFVGDLALTDNLALEAKLRFVRNSTSSGDARTATVQDFSGQNQTLLAKISSHYSASWNYGGLDVLLRFQLSPNSVYVVGGFGFATLLGNSFDGSQSIDSAAAGVSYIDKNTQQPSGVTAVSFPSQSLSNTYNTSRLDLKLGVGTFLALGTAGTVLTPELQVAIPLSDIFNQANLDLYKAASATAPKLWHLDFSIGIKFPWGGSAESGEEPAATESTPANNRADHNADNMVNLKGHVRNKATGKPMDANLTVVDLSNNDVVTTGHTDDDGAYSLPVKSPGKYSVTADKDGYVFGTAFFEVDQDGRILRGKHDIDLTPATGGRTRLLIFFDFDKDELQPDSYPELDRAVKLLKSNPSMKVEIAGYTDNKGTAAYNKDLSLRRAKSVRNYLMKHGIEGSRVTANGYGMEDPIADNDTEDGRAENRRVEFVVQKR